MKKTFFIFPTIVIIAATVLLTMIIPASSQSVSSTPTQTPDGLVTVDPDDSITLVELTPTPELALTDLAPMANDFDKATIIIQQNDGKRVRILLLPDMVKDFVNQIPKEDKIDVIIPPQSIVGHKPPEVNPPVGDQTSKGATETIVGTPPSGP